MVASKVKYSLQEEFNNKKDFAYKVQARQLQGIKEISTHTEKLLIVNKSEKKLFFNAVNYYYRDLCAVVFQLRQTVIKIDDNDQGVSDLQNVITALNKILLSIQDSLNSNIAQLKNQLIGILNDVGFEAGKLLNIVEQDDLHEHKQKVLDAQHDLVISADALKFYVQHSNLSLPKLEGVMQDIFEQIRNNLAKILQKPGHEIHLDDFRYYVRYSVHHLQKHVDYLRKVYNSELRQTDVGTVLNHIESFGTECMKGILNALCDDNPVKKMLDVIDEVCHKQLANVGVTFKNSLQSVGENAEERLKGFFIYIYVFGITGFNAMNKSIEDAILKE